MLKIVKIKLIRFIYRHLPESLYWRYARWLRAKVREVDANNSGLKMLVPCNDGFSMELEVGEWIGSHIILSGEYEPEVAEAFRELLAVGDTVIDVGANVGYFSLLAATRLGPLGRVHAVEASRNTRKLLERNCHVNNMTHLITIHPYAAWKEDTDLQFYEAVSGKRGESSVREQEQYGSAVVVPARRLDTLFSQIESLRLLKIDVEGSEVEVLEGATSLLDRFSPALIFELSPRYLREGGRDSRELLEKLPGYRFFILSHKRSGSLTAEALLEAAGEQQVNVLAQKHS